ncbi:MAG: hypothetical protein COW00_04480 [Bdellovibrio sp. CG12_big_fil_rev_8_21_14_0_65_39_13]|nr:MAG: hypothetical protein COW78_12680 [Bdellovibrio sp. CG22_combo_CG10-13_8_21_14_all_39_27]PIQ61065.1 MAG: hypothetical protein COW00_04480 [Bdellovibrio sp. CG12_big_fil_rev_8_21_14_0_65_39_13]PIR36833.1 MAG: hypothetical protein COV37_01500 [Bdellovibrio sp. CG11_big_fil_rev_8_21_14_0_20_39_38]PJB52801.1 MAG: hypothetical protein CO099_10575 [Bdellovibrio sp. CG_4_9_14_3_um_filter_39_7]
MYSCREATRLMAEEAQLNWFGTAKLKMHVMICPLCKNFQAQMNELKIQIKKNLKRELSQDEKEKVNDLENKIILKIKQSSD